MFGMTPEQFRELIAGELLDLPQHFVMSGPDCVEFGSNYLDIQNAAMLLSHANWFPADYCLHSVLAKAQPVDPCRLRRVIAGTIGYENEIATIQKELDTVEAKALIANLSGKFLDEMRDEAKRNLDELKKKERRVFVKFEIALSGRTARDMREMFILGKTRRMDIDRTHANEYSQNVWNLVAHYLEAKEQKRARDMQSYSGGQEHINLTVGG